ncbi:hypothetical protein [Flagellimonas lutimaris]|uniref:hypothetical protein n=1 Tax=Flagellimonas lutimaris TaxID=475082 RepID=UPI0039C0D9B5
MKKIIGFTPLLLIFLSCDPTSQMEANIENLTSQNLSVVFVSSDFSLGKTFQIAPGQIVLSQEGYDVGSTFLKPSLMEYDSVIIKNQVNETIKVYKRNDSSKNIYNVDEYWMFSEPSKRFFVYEFEIKTEDIE